VNGEHGFWEKNEAGEKILDLASYDIAIVNTYFRKREQYIIDNYITYKSGRNISQIDYFMWKRDSIKRYRDCKVIPG